MRLAGAVLLAVLGACGAARAELPSCPLRSERPMIETQLFFGREIDKRAPVTEQEWSDFASRVVAKNFPDGFTVTDGDGAWFDPASKAAIHEQTKVVTIVTRPSRDLASKLNAVIDTYKRRFRQHSVGIVTRQVCAAF